MTCVYMGAEFMLKRAPWKVGGERDSETWFSGGWAGSFQAEALWQDVSGNEDSICKGEGKWSSKPKINLDGYV